jgi:Zn-dependent peptidase ImmA (M78 family)
VDEFTAILRARELVGRVNPAKIPVPLESYLAEVGCVLRVDSDLSADEPGFSVTIGGKEHIVVNSRDSVERQRFTICHELGHVVLKLPSQHGGVPLWSYSKRPLNEIFCDVFAAELLLPYRLFKPLADDALIGFAALDDLAESFSASVMATGSRFAAAVDVPCAFVISQERIVRYASRSKSLRESEAWIAPGSGLPPGSVSAKANSAAGIESGEIQADQWFTDWRRGGMLLEEARYLPRWKQTLTLLWFDDDEVPLLDGEHQDSEEEQGLKELDGTLPWPGRKKRRP